MVEPKKRAGVHFPVSWIVRFGSGEHRSALKFKLNKSQVNGGLKPRDLQLMPAAESDSVEARDDG
jgi:hypothetical protein